MYFKYGKQSISSKDIKAVSDTLKQELITQGPVVEKFENVLKKKFKSKFAIAMSSGTAALHAAINSLKLKTNDCVITSPITFCATVNSVLYNEAKIYLSDINSSTFTLDINKLEENIKKLKKKNKKIKAVIGVDYAGNPCEWKSLRFLANKYNFYLVNDNCHAMGSKYFGDRGYAAKYADLVTQSYHPVKNLTTGEGGSVLTNNKFFFEKIKLFRSHGIEKKKDQTAKFYPWSYQINNIGYNYRLTDFQCALGISQIQSLNRNIQNRRKIAQKYNLYFENNVKFQIQEVKKNNYHSYHLYSLGFNFENLRSKGFFFNYFAKKYKIIFQVHYVPIHYFKFYQKVVDTKFTRLDCANKFYKNFFSIPIYPSLNVRDQVKIMKLINRFLEKK